MFLSVVVLLSSVDSTGLHAQQKDEARRAREAALQRAEAVRQMAPNRWPDEQFDQWVFQQAGSAAAARQRMESQLSLQIDGIDRSSKLSTAQKKKLELMGRGDIKRFFDAFERAKLRFNQIDNDVNRLQEIMPEITPLQMSIQSGMFQVDSLFAKSLRTTLTSEQRAKYDAEIQERNKLRHRAQIELAVNMIEQLIPLRDSQRREMVDLLVREIAPPKGNYPTYEFYYILYQLGRVPEETFKTILSPTQLKLLNRIAATYKGYEQFLRRNGLLSDEDD
jgi:hypothetical protein